MSKLNDRENAFENKYAHDEKMNFKIEARSAKLFGLWAAEKMGLSGDDARGYAGEIVGAHVEKPGFKNFSSKIKADMAAKGVEMSDHMLQVEFEKVQEEARDQLMNEAE